MSVAAGLTLIVVALEGYVRQALGGFSRLGLAIAGILMHFVSPIRQPAKALGRDVEGKAH